MGAFTPIDELEEDMLPVELPRPKEVVPERKRGFEEEESAREEAVEEERETALGAIGLKSAKLAFLVDAISANIDK